MSNPGNSRNLKDYEAECGEKEPFRDQNIAFAVDEVVDYETASTIAKGPVPGNCNTEESYQDHCITQA